MIPIPEGNDIIILGVQSSHKHGQVISLRSTVDEIDAAEFVWQSGRQTLCIFVDFGVQIDVGGVPQGVHLVLQGLVDLGVTMTNADGHNAAEQVKISEMRINFNNMQSFVQLLYSTVYHCIFINY